MMEAVGKTLPVAWLPSWKENSRTYTLLLSLLGLAIGFHLLSDETFLTPRNLSNLSRQICVNLTLAVGMTLVILTAGIDLSVGSVLALSGTVAAISQVQWGLAEAGLLGAFLSVGIAIAVGASCGAVTGYAVSHLNITPFIVTLGMMVICRGLTLIVSNAQAVAPIGDSLGGLSSNYLAPLPSTLLLVSIVVLALAINVRAIGKGLPKRTAAIRVATALSLCLVGIFAFSGYRGIPWMVFLALATAGLGVFVLSYTRFGRFLFAIGGNREASELAGISVKPTLWITYLIMGCLAGLAGVMDVTRVDGSVPSAGELAELDAIAAVVIGGTSLMGGLGSIGGTLFGVLIMGILNNGMSLMGISEHYQKVFKGIVIISAVYLDRRSHR